MKLKTMFSMAGVSLLAVAALPSQLNGQIAAATPEQSGGPSHYNLTDLGVVGPIPGQPFHIADDGLIAGSAAVNNADLVLLCYPRVRLDIGILEIRDANSVPCGVARCGE